MSVIVFYNFQNNAKERRWDEYVVHVLDGNDYKRITAMYHNQWANGNNTYRERLKN